jgi:hypothetical protein
MFSFSSVAEAEAAVEDEVGLAVLLVLFLVKSQRVAASTGAPPPKLLLGWMQVVVRKNKGSVVFVVVDLDDDVEIDEEEGEFVLVLSMEERVDDIVNNKQMTPDFVALY